MPNFVLKEETNVADKQQNLGSSFNMLECLQPLDIKTETTNDSNQQNLTSEFVLETMMTNILTEAGISHCELIIY